MISGLISHIKQKKGFTVVELLVVIGVIGILATIIVVAYGSWRNSIIATQLKSDLNSASTAMENARNFGTGYPLTLPSTIVPSNHVSLTLSPGSTVKAFCIDAVSSDNTSITYYIASDSTSDGAQTGTCASRVDVPKPDIPAGLAVTGTTDTTISLSWTAATYASTYTTQCATDSSFIGGLSSNTQAGLSAVVGSLSGSTSYVCRVSATNAVGTSGWSSVVSGTTSGLSAPTGLVATTMSLTQINYSWAAKSGAQSYNLQFSTDSTFVSGVTSVSQTGISGTSPGLSANTTYYYRVQAVSLSGDTGAWSANVSATTMIQGFVTTLAGSGTAGFLDATGTSAQFSSPYSTAVDSSGNVYVGDSVNNRIRKITPAGVTTTFAGSGVAGSTDATGTAARFSNPRGLAVDSSDNVYVADLANNRIRKITSAGVVTTLAGSTSGYTDATGTLAKFAFPYGVAVDNSGNVYVADYSNNRIRKVTSAGVVTTLAGSTAGYTDATGASAQFNGPYGVDVDSSGNVYVGDYSNNRIRKVTSAGVVTTLAGSTAGYTDATGASAQFNGPRGVALDSLGNLYVADGSNNRIRKVTSAGVVTTLAGSTAGYTDATGASAQFSNPTGIAFDSSGSAFVSDATNNRIRKIR